MRKLTLIFIIILLALSCSCSSKINKADDNIDIKPSNSLLNSPTISPWSSDVLIPSPSSEILVTPNPLLDVTPAPPEMDLSKQNFLNYLHKKDPQIKIENIIEDLPDIIAEYGDFNIIEPSYVTDRDLYILAYISPSNTELEIDEVIWKNFDEPKNEKLFEIINIDDTYIKYQYHDNIKIYVPFPGTDVFYVIPLDYLQVYLDRNYNLFHVYIENNRIKTLLGCSIP